MRPQRLPTVHEAHLRHFNSDPSAKLLKNSITTGFWLGVPKALVLIVLGITFGAALTATTMAITGGMRRHARPGVGEGLQSDDHAWGSMHFQQSAAMPRITHEVPRPRPVSFFTLTNQGAADIPSNMGQAHRLFPLPQPQIPQRLQEKSFSGKGRVPLTDEDFVHAIVTSQGHESLALEGRMWRRSRTFLVTNYTTPESHRMEAARYGETWAYYPDDRPLRTLALQGDSRAAITPFMAHRYYDDTYKWMLYGDDDTYFFSHALKHTLQSLDPDMPYFLTDHLWWTDHIDGFPDKPKEDSPYHPHPGAPRCTPCNFQKNTSGLPFPLPSGCPCTPQILCGADPKQEFLAQGPKGTCPMPRVPIRTYSMHGGAGAVLSVGLMRTILLESFEDCIRNTYSTGGDAMISICLWEAGFGMTDVDPMWHPRNLSMFDVGRAGQGDPDDIKDRLAIVLRTQLQMAAGVCTLEACQSEWNHMLTLHLRSRKFPSRLAHQEFTRILSGLAAIARGEPNPFEQKSKNETLSLVNGKVLVAMEAVRTLSLMQDQQAAASKLSPPLGIVMDDARTAAADAVAHATIDAIWEATKPPAPPPPSPVLPPPFTTKDLRLTNPLMGKVLPNTA